MLSPVAGIAAAVLMSVVVLAVIFAIWALLDKEKEKEKRRNLRWSHVAIWQGNGSLDSMFHITYCPRVEAEVLVDDLEQKCGACWHDIKYEHSSNAPKRKHDEWFNEKYLSRRDVQARIMALRAEHQSSEAQAVLSLLQHELNRVTTVNNWYNGKLNE